MPDNSDTIDFGWFVTGGFIADKTGSGDTLAVAAKHFDSMWVSDHFYGFANPPDARLECWTLMTWLLAKFPTVRVGPIVLGVGYRPPALLANMAATLQTLSAGRFIMGIGAGWRQGEYTAYGYPFPPAPVRIKQLEEAVEIMRLMWTQPAPSYQGQYFQIENAYCEPRPETAIPLMIGGGGEKLMLPLVGRVADIWDVFHGSGLEGIDLERYQQKLAIVKQSADAAGREVRQSFTIEGGALPKTSQDSANWVKSLVALRDVGVRQFILTFELDAAAEDIQRFADEVIAVVRS